MRLNVHGLPLLDSAAQLLHQRQLKAASRLHRYIERGKLIQQRRAGQRQRQHHQQLTELSSTTTEPACLLATTQGENE